MGTSRFLQKPASASLLRRLAPLAAEQGRHLPALLVGLLRARRGRRCSCRAARRSRGVRRLARALRLLLRARVGRVLVAFGPALVVVLRTLVLLRAALLMALGLWRPWLLVQRVAGLEASDHALIHLARHEPFDRG